MKKWCKSPFQKGQIRFECIWIIYKWIIFHTWWFIPRIISGLFSQVYISGLTPLIPWKNRVVYHLSVTVNNDEIWFGPSGAKLGGKTWKQYLYPPTLTDESLKETGMKGAQKVFCWEVVTCLATLSLLRTCQSCGHHFWGMQGKKKLRAKIQEAHGFVRFTDQTYTHERSTKCSKYFEGPWGARPLVIVEGPKCSKIMITLFMLSVSKNLRFTNADAGPLRFYPKKWFRKGMRGVRPLWKTANFPASSGPGPS